MPLHLVLGGARSGKSGYALAAAETSAARQAVARVFIATAEARDAEMSARIRQHQAERGDAGRVVEAPLDLAHALDGLDGETALIDCLTLWLSNSMLAADDGHGRRTEALFDALGRRRGDTWLVSNEVGWGIVPDNALARRFRDEAGRLNQRVATVADEVVLVVAGLPMVLKGGG